jgi:hypothetical protein
MSFFLELHNPGGKRKKRHLFWWIWKFNALKKLSFSIYQLTHSVLVFLRKHWYVIYSEDYVLVTYLDLKKKQ